jgi:hypothetical protein
MKSTSKYVQLFVYFHLSNHHIENETNPMHQPTAEDNNKTISEFAREQG